MRIHKILILFLVLSSVIVCSLDLNTASLDRILSETGIDMLDAMSILEYRKRNRIEDVEQIVSDNVIRWEVGQKIKKALRPVEQRPQENLRIEGVDSVSRTRSQSPQDDTVTYEKIFQRILKNMQKKDYDSALSEISFFVKKNRADSVKSIYIDDVIYFTGAIFEEKGNIDKAIKYYRTILDKYYNSDITVIAIYRIAICHEKSGDNDNAVRMYTKLTKEFSESIWAEKA
ncbi:MAG: tetratricopeptide repeat protein, partial [Candidatus Muiribacteriaceae bacterium]